MKKLIFISTVIFYISTSMQLNAQTNATSIGSGLDWTIKSGFTSGSSSPSFITLDGDNGIGGSVFIQSDGGLGGYGNINLNAQGSNSNIYFKTLGVTKLTLNPTGYLGIGTTAPTTRFHINETSTINPFMIQISGTTKLLAGNNGGLTIGAATAPPANGLYVAGNVGIGTSSPGTIMLFINGATDHSKTSLKVLGDVNFESGNFDFSNPLLTVAKARVAISSYLGVPGLRFVMSEDGLFGPGHQVDALFLSPTGNVGIGTTQPSSKLTVKGEILCSKVRVVDIANIPDFVFNSDYKFMTINQVEKFVKEYKHLPDVPSANEFKNNGMDMVEMNKILLQKIEEQMLYIFELNARIKNLETNLNIVK